MLFTLYHPLPLQKNAYKAGNFWGCENVSFASSGRHVDRPTFQNHQHPKGPPCNPAMHLGMKPNRPKPGPHDAAAPAQIVTTLGDALPVRAWHGQPPGQAQQMQAGRQQARRWSRRQAPRRPQGMDTDGRQDDCRDGRPARQNGAQSRTEDAQPQPVRIAENTSMHLSL